MRRSTPASSSARFRSVSFATASPKSRLKRRDKGLDVGRDVLRAPAPSRDWRSRSPPRCRSRSARLRTGSAWNGCLPISFAIASVSWISPPAPGLLRVERAHHLGLKDVAAGQHQVRRRGALRAAFRPGRGPRSARPSVAPGSITPYLCGLARPALRAPRRYCRRPSHRPRPSARGSRACRPSARREAAPRTARRRRCRARTRRHGRGRAAAAGGRVTISPKPAREGASDVEALALSRIVVSSSKAMSK